MSISVNHHLTPSEIQQLASLVPRRKPLMPPTAQVLHPMLDFLKPRWLRNYFFTPDAIHVPHLASPSFLSTAITCRTRSTSIDPAPVPPTSPFLPGESHDLMGNVMFVPIVTTQDQLTIGVGVLHAAATCLPWITNKHASNIVHVNIRFARDAKTRTLFMMHDIPDSDCCLLVTATVESPTRTPKTAAVFRRTELRDFLLHQDGDVNTDQLAPLLVEIQHQVHYRKCVICGAPPNACCSCQLGLPPPAHPFDSLHFRHGMAQHVSNTQAIATRAYYRGGIARKHTVLGSQMSLCGVTDMNVALYLGKWSVSHYLKSVTEDPFQSHLTFDNLDAIANGDGITARAQDVDEGRKSMNTIGPCEPSQVIDAVVDATVGNGFVSSTIMTEDGVLYERTHSHISQKVESNARGGNSGAPDGSPHYSSGSVVLGTENAMTEGELWPREQQGPSHKLVQCDSPEETVERHISAATTLPAAETIHLPKRQLTAEEEAIRLAKIKKAKERREKNRLAAHKSNMRNKRKREQLKIDLEDATSQAEMLRAREVALRKENLHLRRLLENQY